MDEDLQKQLKTIQTALHDQVSSLRDELHKVRDDVDASITISAELEKEIKETETTKTLENMSDTIFLNKIQNTIVARTIYLLSSIRFTLLGVLRLEDLSTNQTVGLEEIVKVTFDFDKNFERIYGSENIEETLEYFEQICNKLDKCLDSSSKLINELKARHRINNKKS